ncbi:MAG: hypothetical protein JXR89_09050 [Deltaproteobacteria bacterium]|nr:hypothetical protein [Deltaproteobacteria bacterium]
MTYQKMRKPLATGALLLTVFAIGALLYGPGLNYPFFFDDYNSLMNDQGLINPKLAQPEVCTRDLILAPLRPDRSLTWLTFAASYRVGKMNPGAYRAVNLFLHCASALLLYLILVVLLKQEQASGVKTQSPSPMEQGKILAPALIATLFFLVHPLALNSVLYISQRFGLLAAFFYLTAFYAWLKARRPVGAPSRLSSKFWFLGAGLAFWAALHSKEMTLTLPLTILFYEFYTGRINPARPKNLLLTMLALSLIGVGFLLFALKIGLFNRNWINIGFCSSRLWSPGIQFASEVRAFFHYWLRLFLPLPQWLSLHHEFSPSASPVDPVALTALAGHAVLLVGAWKLRRALPHAGFGIFWFYLVLAPPYLPLPQKELLVEYKTYLAAPGAAMLLASLLAAVGRGLFQTSRTGLKIILGGFLGIWLFFLVLTTWHREAVFAGPLSLWNDVLIKYSASRRALNNRAVAYLKNRQPELALADLDQLIIHHPDYARGFENRGRLRLYFKDFVGAAADLRKALELLPAHPELKKAREELSALEKAARRAAGKER